MGVYTTQLLISPPGRLSVQLPQVSRPPLLLLRTLSFEPFLVREGVQPRAETDSRGRTVAEG